MFWGECEWVNNVVQVRWRQSVILNSSTLREPRWKTNRKPWQLTLTWPGFYAVSVHLSFKAFWKVSRGKFRAIKVYRQLCIFWVHLCSALTLPNAWTNYWRKTRRLLEYIMENSWIQWTLELLFCLTFSTLLKTLRAITFVSSQPTHTHTHTHYNSQT